MASDIYPPESYDDLTAYEVDVLQNRPDEVTPMMAGTLRHRRARMRLSDRELVDRVLAEREAKREKKVVTLSDAERAELDKASARGAERAQARIARDRAPYSFEPKGDDAA